jgi:dihydrofolate reductase/thymidylate synthase
MKSFGIIVAIDEEGGIGKDGALPWSLSADLAHFKELTVGEGRNAVIMGRKTWDSIPPELLPLRGRRNIVLTRQSDLELGADVIISNDLGSALMASADCDDSFVIGGGELYKEALEHPSCDTCHLTAIHSRFDCDTFFLPDEKEWSLESASTREEERDIAFSFCVYKRDR